MRKININHVSNAENLRLYVLEYTLIIEELISDTIGTILNIDWKNSKSFGFTSTALGFNQKVSIIQDLKDITSDESKKFTYLMNIRNKFAHVISVESSHDFYTIAGNGIEIKNTLEKWYSKTLPQSIGSNEDDIFKFYIKLLCKDLSSKLWDIILKTQLEKVTERNEQYFSILQYVELISAIRDLPNGITILKDIEEKTGKTF